MKIIFAGTPAFAAVALQALIDSPHEIVAVYTQPDRPAGRGLKLKASPVKQLAEQHHLTVLQPQSLKGEVEQAELRNFAADAMVVAAYGLLLPKAVLAIPRLGCINIHPSKLPRWRGAAPIQRTIWAGDTETAVCIMQMDAGLDTGPILSTTPYTLASDETAQTLQDKLAGIGAMALVETLAILAQGKIKAIAQDDAIATYAKKITKEEALIDWQKPIKTIDCMIRAFNPWPMAYTLWQGEHLRIANANIISTEKTHVEPGTIISASESGIDVAVSDGVLSLQQLQLPGGKMLSVADFYHARQQQFVPGKQLV